MKVLLDTDVLLDVALGRADFGPASASVLAWCQRTPQTAVIAWHSVSNLFYLLSAGRSGAFARNFLNELLQFIEVASGDTASVRHALNMRLNDFEDALQVTAAISSRAECIITRNVRDYRAAAIPAMKPDTFLARLAS